MERLVYLVGSEAPPESLREGLLSALVSVWLPNLDARAGIEGPLRSLADRFADFETLSTVLMSEYLVLDGPWKPH